MDTLNHAAAPNADEVIPELYARASVPLRASLVRSANGNGELADDILQDTWAQAILTWREQGVPARPVAWLATVSRNLMLNAVRRIRRTSGQSSDLLNAIEDTSREADVVARLERSERNADLRRAMSTLSAADTVLLNKFYFESTSVADLALSLGVSNRAVEGRLRRARTRLRAALKKSHDPHFAGSSFKGLEPVGLASAVAMFVRKTVALALLPFALMLAFAPLAFKLHRLPRRRLAWLRIGAGIVGVIVVTVSLPIAARENFAQLLRIFFVGLAAWGIWMLLTPREASGTHKGT